MTAAYREIDVTITVVQVSFRDGPDEVTAKVEGDWPPYTPGGTGRRNLGLTLGSVGIDIDVPRTPYWLAWADRVIEAWDCPSREAPRPPHPHTSAMLDAFARLGHGPCWSAM